MIPEVRLKPRADKRARAGHPWIFSNEIDGSVKAPPPQDLLYRFLGLQLRGLMDMHKELKELRARVG